MTHLTRVILPVKNLSPVPILILLLWTTALTLTEWSEVEHWNQGKAEVLQYRLTIPFRDRMHHTTATLITEKAFLDASGSLHRKQRNSSSQPLIRSQIHYAFKESHFDYRFQSETKMSGGRHPTVVRQEVAVQSWEGVVYRQLDQQDGSSQLHERGSRLRAHREMNLDQFPVVPEEGLWSYLRTLQPTTEGVTTSIWLLESQLTPAAGSQVRYCDVVLEPQKRRIQENETWLVYVTTEEGLRYTFWIMDTVTRPIVRAQFPNGAQWELQKIVWKRYWEW